MSNKTSKAQIKSIRKWEKDNVYKVTISFYKNRLPKEKYEEAKSNNSSYCNLADLENLKTHLDYFIQNDKVTSISIKIGDDE